VKGRYILASFLSAGMSLTGFVGEQIYPDLIYDK